MDVVDLSLIVAVLGTKPSSSVGNDSYAVGFRGSLLRLLILLLSTKFCGMIGYLIPGLGSKYQ
jgi:hypothetical protein